MSVVLEDVNPEDPAEPAESVSIQNTEMTPEPESISADVADPEPANDGVEDVPPPPAPKKRGRPKKDPALPKAAPKPRAKRAAAPVAPPPPESSDEEPFSQNDLETEILSFLVQRKTQQQDRRRQLWTQLAGL